MRFKGGESVLQNLFSREPYSCLHFLSDPDSVLLLAVSKIMMPNVLDQIRSVNSDHADSILRDCIFLLTGKGFKVIFGFFWSCDMTHVTHVCKSDLFSAREINIRQTKAP